MHPGEQREPRQGLQNAPTRRNQDCRSVSGEETLSLKLPVTGRGAGSQHAEVQTGVRQCLPGPELSGSWGPWWEGCPLWWVWSPHRAQGPGWVRWSHPRPGPRQSDCPCSRV